MSWLGRFLGARAARRLNIHADELVAGSVELGIEVAQWKADSELLHTVQEAILPAALVLAAIFVANPAITWLGGGVEAHRIGIGLLALAGFGWACWISAVGLIWFLRHLRMMLITGLGPRPYLRLVIALAARDWLRDQAAWLGAGTSRAFLESFQRATGHRTETLAARLADAVAARLWRHVALRLGAVLAPIFVGLIYYRAVIYPGFLGENAWLGMFYPLAALVDVLAGTNYRASLI